MHARGLKGVKVTYVEYDLSTSLAELLLQSQQQRIVLHLVGADEHVAAEELVGLRPALLFGEGAQGLFRFVHVAIYVNGSNIFRQPDTSTTTWHR